MKFSKYGGYSESGDSANVINCVSGILHSGLVKINVDIASCHIRRMTCSDVGDVSSLIQSSISIY